MTDFIAIYLFWTSYFPVPYFDSFFNPFFNPLSDIHNNETLGILLPKNIG